MRNILIRSRNKKQTNKQKHKHILQIYTHVYTCIHSYTLSNESIYTYMHMKMIKYLNREVVNK